MRSSITAPDRGHRPPMRRSSRRASTAPGRTRPDRPKGRGLDLPSLGRGGRGARAGVQSLQTEDASDPGNRARQRAGAPGRIVCCLRPDDPRPAPVRSRLEAAQRPLLAPPAAPRRRTDRGPDARRRCGDRRHDHRDDRGARPDRSRPAIPCDRRRRLRRARGAAREGRRRAHGRGARPARRRRPPSRAGRRAQATYAAKIDPAERRLDPACPRWSSERGAGADPARGHLPRAEGGDRLGVLEAAAEPGELARGSARDRPRPAVRLREEC